MKCLRLHLIAEEPLLLACPLTIQKNLTHSDAFSGNILLGALANHWKSKHKEDPDTSQEFYDLFINGAISFGSVIPYTTQSHNYSIHTGQITYLEIPCGTTLSSQLFCTEEYYTTLCNLLQQGTRLQFGHARSIGYGQVVIVKFEASEMQQEFLVKAGQHKLYLESAFFPEKSWQQPLEGLLAFLQQYLGTISLQMEQSNWQNFRLEGFNNFWRLPRATRIGLAAGSTVVFTSSQEGHLPRILGKWQQEGYGRILLDNSQIEQIQDIADSKKEASFVQKVASSKQELVPLLKIWRNRTCLRLSIEQAIDCVWHSPVFDAFFEKLTHENKPSQSQRGNLRKMLFTQPASTWIPSFEDMLEKQPGKQWKQVRTNNPFATGFQRDTLDKIMLNLFNPDTVDQCMEEKHLDFWHLPLLPGLDLDKHEEQQFRQNRHQRLLLELLRRWEKEFRTLEAKS